MVRPGALPPSLKWSVLLKDLNGFDKSKGKAPTKWDYLMMVTQAESERYENEYRMKRLKFVFESRESVYDEIKRGGLMDAVNLGGECSRTKKMHKITNDVDSCIRSKYKQTGECLRKGKRHRIPDDVRKPYVHLGPEQDIDLLPQVVKRYIEGLRSNEIHLVCEKYLTKTDVDKNEHRLLMPMRIIRCPEFLQDNEKKFLETRLENTKTRSEKRVPLLEPGLGVCEMISLRMWEMKKKNGKAPTLSYVLAGGWNGVVDRNRLKEGSLVRVWSFRVDSQLHLALTSPVAY